MVVVGFVANPKNDFVSVGAVAFAVVVAVDGFAPKAKAEVGLDAFVAVGAEAFEPKEKTDDERVELVVAVVAGAVEVEVGVDPNANEEFEDKGFDENNDEFRVGFEPKENPDDGAAAAVVVVDGFPPKENAGAALDAAVVVVVVELKGFEPKLNEDPP